MSVPFPPPFHPLAMRFLTNENSDQEEMFHLMGHNIGLNNLEDRVKHLILNWYVDMPMCQASRPLACR